MKKRVGDRDVACTLFRFYLLFLCLLPPFLMLLISFPHAPYFLSLYLLSPFSLLPVFILC